MENIKEKIPNKNIRTVNRILDMWGGPVILLILAIELIFLLGFYYFDITKQYNEEYQLIISGLITVLATFFGVFSAFLQERNNDRENDRRKLKFYLGLTWNELRSNLFLVDGLKKNYQFDQILKIKPFPLFILMLSKKYAVIAKLSRDLSNSSFVAMQNSAAITTIDNDEIFNNIQMAYENIGNLKNYLNVTKSDFAMKMELIEKIPGNIDELSRQKIVADAVEKVQKGKDELDVASITIKNAVGMIDKKLNSLGVMCEEVPRPLPTPST